MRYGLAGLAVVVAACSFDADYSGAVFACEPDGSCPDSFVCVDQRCVASTPSGASSCTDAISAGADHTCAIRSDGTAWCWGRNEFGQLGDGTNEDRSEPVQIAKLTKVTAIDGGEDHSCAIDDASKVWCWGRNQAGQLGAGMSDSSVPVAVTSPAGTTSATAIATGFAHSCAIFDGNLACWGANESGQLGAHGTSPSNIPIVIPDLAGVTAVAVAGSTTCAVHGDHKLACWGNNDRGQLGDGTNQPKPVPTPVAIDGVAGVALGAVSTCAVTVTGEVWCFGSNDHGQLGTPIDLSLTPIQVALPAKAVAIAAGDRFACAVDDAHQLWCWGDNSDFEVDATAFETRTVPVLLGYADIADITAGRAHLCMRTQAGSVTCGGFNGRGELGNGIRTTQGTPQPGPAISGAVSLAAGAGHTCAVLGDDAKSVACWGVNLSGQLGDGTRVARAKPVAVLEVHGASQVVTGANHTCALTGDTVQCWGLNLRGQLGDGTFDTHGVARPVLDAASHVLTGVSQIAAGGDHTCAIAGAGSAAAVVCWGQNGNGQNGNGTRDDSAVARPVVLPPGVPAGALAIAVGAGHACAVAGNHTVVCWGDDYFGQLGRGLAGQGNAGATAVPPTAVAMLQNIDQLSSHGLFTCAHSTAGAVSCWGVGGEGELGNNGFFGSDVPQKTIASGASKVVTGGDHGCAILNGGPAGGSLECWGASFFGQVGDGGYDNHLVPQPVTGLSGVVDVTAGDQHTCARLADGGLKCWGDGRAGQLGDGVIAPIAPVAPRLKCP